MGEVDDEEEEDGEEEEDDESAYGLWSASLDIVNEIRAVGDKEGLELGNSRFSEGTGKQIQQASKRSVCSGRERKDWRSGIKQPSRPGEDENGKDASWLSTPGPGEAGTLLLALLTSSARGMGVKPKYPRDESTGTCMERDSF